MNKRPSEEQIIDFLFGYLTPEERNKFEEYLQTDAELRNELEQLVATRKLMAVVADEEVIEPPMDQIVDTTSNRSLLPRSVWIVSSIAASICLIMLMGFMTNMNITYANREISLSFGEPTEARQQANFSSLLADYKKTSSHELQQATSLLRADLTNLVLDSQERQQEEIKKFNTRPRLSKTQVDTLINEFKQANTKSMQEFYSQSSEQQEAYLKSLFAQFYEYLDKQREQDLKFIQANMLRLKNDTDERQEQTEEVLARIITTVNQDNSIGQ